MGNWVDLPQPVNLRVQRGEEREDDETRRDESGEKRESYGREWVGEKRVEYAEFEVIGGWKEGNRVVR